MSLVSSLLIGAAHALVGASARWEGCAPSRAQRIYVANHTSHLDALVVWAALPPDLRERTHPVAARDYWERGRLRPWLARTGFNAVLIDRAPRAHGPNPLDEALTVLDRGHSLILFPEGTRGGDAVPGTFKGGLHRLAEAAPEAELVPVFLDNLHRSLPRGSFVPLPILCTVRIGTPFRWNEGEPRAAFLARARDAVLATGGLAPDASAETPADAPAEPSSPSRP